MLVLSRKEDQKVLIPALDISIKVIRCKGSSVTLGFDAPPEIRIARDEIESGVPVDDPAFAKLMEEKVLSYPDEQRHEVRDQFNIVSMALQILRDDIESGELKSVSEVFESVCQRLSKLKSTSNDSDAFALVVEDQANERELLAGILRMNGYRVATASDGNEALKYLEENPAPAFILVDMHMPGCDGVELVRRIRSSVELKNIRVYVVSGSNRDECDLAPESVDGWYTKPLAPLKLIKAMANN